MRLLVIASLLSFLQPETTDAHRYYHHEYHRSRSNRQSRVAEPKNSAGEATLLTSQRPVLYQLITGSTVLDAFSGRNPVINVPDNCTYVDPRWRLRQLVRQ